MYHLNMHRTADQGRLGSLELHASNFGILQRLRPPPHWDQTTLPLSHSEDLESGQHLPAPSQPTLRHPSMRRPRTRSARIRRPFSAWPPSGALRPWQPCETKPLASWLAHETIDGMTSAHWSQILGRRALEASFSSRGSACLFFQEGESATSNPWSLPMGRPARV